jgi:hypothetical protein
MMEPMASIRRTRGEAKKAAQAFHDVAILLLLLLAVFSVRVSSDEEAPSAHENRAATDKRAAAAPMPGGVQAAESDPVGASTAESSTAESSAAELAAVPALASPLREDPRPAARGERREQQLQVNLGRLVLVEEGQIHEVRLPMLRRISLTLPAGDRCETDPEQRIEPAVQPLTRS